MQQTTLTRRGEGKGQRTKRVCLFVYKVSAIATSNYGIKHTRAALVGRSGVRRQEREAACCCCRVHNCRCSLVAECSTVEIGKTLLVPAAYAASA